jgi:glycerol-3-phosphate acyltransferase PlsX
LVTIALDAMGGDHAPDEIVKGAVRAANEYKVHILLVGNEAILNSFNITHPGISIVHASDVIEMDEAPMQAYKKKKNSSIHVGLELVKHSKAQAFLSAGNTGAVMSCSLFILGRIPGVDRPALASVIPTKHGQALMLDMGSNVDTKPVHLNQYAVMGHFFSSQVLHVQTPRVGLINIGEEKEKGNQLTQEAYHLLRQNKTIQFVGNLEGKDILFHKADVVLCDGFVGNALLKFGEGLVDFILAEIKYGISTASFLSKIGGVLLRPVFKKIKKRIDYEEYGGAPLLGINGISFVAHGKSKEKAIFNAIRSAIDAVQSNMIEKISTAFQNEYVHQK